MSKEQQQRRGGPGIFGLVAPVIAVAGGWIAYSNTAIDHDLPLPKMTDAERKTFHSAGAGELSYYIAQEAAGRPLVLIHSINAAGCAYEMRPLFEHYRSTRPVYALELPGFGFSERSDREYSAALYTQAILDFMTEVVGEAADAVALSLGCEFLARAADTQPESFASLTMISPSGFTARGEGRATQKASQQGSSDFFYNLFSFPLWGRPLFDLIATRASIRFFLGQSFEGPMDMGLAEYGYLTAHQPGAHYAPLYFVSGKLFTRDIITTYERLTMPVLVLHDRDNFVNFDDLPGLLERASNWQRVRITPTLGLPHFEKLAETVAALDGFWG